MITHHTQLLNALIEKYNLKSYLEIGVQNPANNLYNIKCDWYVGVDPEYTGTDNRIIKTTSDIYFDYAVKLSGKFDLIFIDGLHHADQVKRDFENSLRCLNDNGFIVIHDVLPENEEGTIVPRQTKVWWGDVYKFAMLMAWCKEVDFKTFNIDNGCMLIWKKKTDAYLPGMPIIPTWNIYKSDGKKYLNVTDEVTI